MKSDFVCAFVTVFITVTLFALVPSVSFANDARWQEDRDVWFSLNKQEMSVREDCDRRWDILWRHAKQGNLEARAMMSMQFAPQLPLLPQIVPPGRTGDEISLLRDATIMAIHADDFQFDDGDRNDVFAQHKKTLYGTFLDRGTFSGGAYLACLKAPDNTAADCRKRASAYVGEGFKTKLVPAFEDYAREIDAAVSAGMKPHCFHYRQGSDWTKIKQEFITPD